MTSTSTRWRESMASFSRTVHWPEDALVAMTVGVALESFDRQSQVALAGKPGVKDAFSLSYGEYGVRTGLWRLLEIFDEFGIRATFSVSGRLADEWPEAVAAAHAAGHELIGHGWVNDVFLNEADEDAERDIVRRTLDAIEKASGYRPTGWASPANSSSERSKSIFLEEGITWTGDDASDDIPFVEEIDGKRMAVLPKVNLAANDLIHWILPTNSPAVLLEGFTDTFDTIYDEGRSGSPKWADVVLHCHMAGRPVFIPTLRRLLQYVRGHANVWWTTKGELAAWTLEQDFTR